MKNYYDELEVSKTASKEVIEKVYKILAKKYHPDTTQETDKHAAEEKFKVISEAYEILSDDVKRKKYDSELEQSNPTISYEDYMNAIKQRDSLNNELSNFKNKFYTNSNLNNNYNEQNDYNTTQNSVPKNNNHFKFKKSKYYYTSTGKPASAFAYYKYKIKEFFSNLFIFIMIIFILISIIQRLINYILF